MSITWIQLCQESNISQFVLIFYSSFQEEASFFFFQDNEKSTKNEKTAIKRTTVRQSFIHITWRKNNVMLQWLIKQKCVCHSVSNSMPLHCSAVKGRQMQYNQMSGCNHSFVCGQQIFFSRNIILLLNSEFWTKSPFSPSEELAKSLCSRPPLGRSWPQSTAWPHVPYYPNPKFTKPEQINISNIVESFFPKY